MKYADRFRITLARFAAQDAIRVADPGSNRFAIKSLFTLTTQNACTFAAGGL
jgi:hypothetical protein